MVQLTEGARRHALVRDEDHLRHYREGKSFSDYTVDESALARVRDRLQSPRIIARPQGGWSLRFTTVCGRMLEKQELGNESIEVSDDYVLDRSARQVLSRRIFSQTPAVRY